MPSLAEVADEIRAHKGAACGYEPCETCTQLVPGEGPQDARVVFLGEAPGAKEDESGRPFVGASGRFLDQALAAAGLDRAEVFITNVHKARPPENRDPTKAEVEHHLPWLVAQLELLQPELVVPLGRHALGHFAPELKIMQVRGTILERGGRRLLPFVHPAAAMRGHAARAAFLEDGRRLGEALGTLPAS